MKPLLVVADAAESHLVAGGALGLDLELDKPATARTDESATTAKRDLADKMARILVIALFTFLAVRIGQDFFTTGRLTGLLLVASEALVVVLTLLRRAPAVVDRSVRARVLTGLSLAGPLMVLPSSVAALAPELITVAISAVGLLVVIAGKVSLGRSFGLIPANRGIVSTGLYRVVRHPIYLGYLITHVAFVAANPSTWNIALLVTGDIALLARAVCEERTLSLDKAYRSYQARVRWRVVPGLY